MSNRAAPAGDIEAPSWSGWTASRRINSPTRTRQPRRPTCSPARLDELTTRSAAPPRPAPAAESLPVALLLDDEDEAAEEDSPLVLEPVRPPARRRPRRPEPEPEGQPEERPRPREERRPVYAEIVRLRRVLAVWARLRALLDDPEATLARRADVVALMGRLAELRPLLPGVRDVAGQPGRPGGIVAALARQHLVIDTFRNLLPGQRIALADDCRAAHFALSVRYADLRDLVRRAARKGFCRRLVRPVARAAWRRPEWIALLIGAAALAVAFVRSATGTLAIP